MMRSRQITTKAKPMKLELRRVVLFTVHMDAMSQFYGERLGHALAKNHPGWKDYRAGSCAMALHKGDTKVGNRPPKLAFYAADVATTRATLERRGAKMGKVISTGRFVFCDGKDP